MSGDPGVAPHQGFLDPGECEGLLAGVGHQVVDDAGEAVCGGAEGFVCVDGGWGAGWVVGEAAGEVFGGHPEALSCYGV